MFQEISGSEAARHLRRLVTRKEQDLVWLVGAGCSESSGVPDAASAVRGWLEELQYLETGQCARQTAALNAWAARRFHGFDATDVAAHYGQVFHTLHQTEEDRARGVERLVKNAEPGFGYATLAQLMAHERWGRRSNLALTTNVDDLVATALHLYSQRRPQTLSVETLDARTPISPATPTVVKLFGDAHLPGSEPVFSEPARARLRSDLADAALIVVGYHGRDACILDLLEGLPNGAPAGGVLWANQAPPQGDLANWMQRARAIWVKDAEFDALMYRLRLEFGIGHPKLDRFERILLRYEAQYRELSERVGLRVAPRPEGDRADGEREAPKAQRDSDKPIPELSAVAERFSKKDAKALERAGPEEVAALRDCARYTLEQLRDVDAAGKMLARALSLDPQDPETLRARAAFLLRAHGDVEKAEDCLRLAVEVAPGNAAALIASARLLDERRGRLDAAEALMKRAAAAPTAETGAAAAAKAELALFQLERLGDADAAERSLIEAAQMIVKAPSVADAGATEGLLSYAQAVLAHRRGDLDHAETAYRRAVEAAPDLVRAQIAFARFLATKRNDPTAAEARYLAAIDAAPNAAAPLSAYARFLDQRGLAPKAAEARHRAAMELEPYDLQSLVGFAEHLSRRKETVSQAERLFRQALSLAPRSGAVLCAFGGFLHRVMGDLDGAEAHLRRAATLDQHNAATLGALDRFLREARGVAGAAEAGQREEMNKRAPDEPREAVQRLGALLRSARRDPSDFERRQGRATPRTRPKSA